MMEISYKISELAVLYQGLKRRLANDRDHIETLNVIRSRKWNRTLSVIEQ